MSDCRRTSPSGSQWTRSNHLAALLLGLLACSCIGILDEDVISQRTRADGGTSGPTGSGGETGKDGSTGATGGNGGSGGATGGNPDAPQICTSMTDWTGGNGATMQPGTSCITCHTNYTIAGTVYPTLHEPMNCYGKSGVQVVITPASGAALTLTTNTAGNFYSTMKIAMPFSAKLVVNGVERPMMAAQTTGECNSCHTPNGANLAPGRIMMP
jgi:hypothetical protein